VNRRTKRRNCGWVVGLWLLAAGAAQARSVEWHGQLGLRARSVRAPVSFAEGGFGRLPDAAEGADRAAEGASALGQLAVRWEPSLVFAAYAHVLARSDDEALGGDHFGLVEAYLEGRRYLRSADELRLRVGAQILPVTRANLDPLWQSAYTLSFSAIDTWIGEEVRPLGLDARYLLRDGRGDEWLFGLQPFVGNDTAGALLAWRGWSIGDRLTPVGEVLPLPALISLREGFPEQRGDGTRPVGRDLDGRLGWMMRSGWARPERARIEASWYDNRGDRALHRGEYAWETRFATLAGELETGRWRWILQGLGGETGMGAAGAPAWVEADFAAAFGLLAWEGERATVALRGDWFEVRDRDHSPRGEDNDERGTAWALAVRYRLGRGWSLAAELGAVDARRPGLAAEGVETAPTTQRTLFELRWVF
jgi:hypothetical protein